MVFFVDLHYMNLLKYYWTMVLFKLLIWTEEGQRRMLLMASWLTIHLINGKYVCCLLATFPSDKWYVRMLSLG